MRTKCLLIGLIVGTTLQAMPQVDTLALCVGRDTLETQPPRTIERTLDRITSNKVYRMTYAGVPLVVAGALVKRKDDRFRQLRNDYLPRFHRTYDNYLQYLPAAVMIGMKAGGVEGRSSWGRMLTSDAFSTMLMASAVNTLKHTTQVMRPDGSNRHSFPSGHTATAFMTATMLSKEYGDKYPWMSVGAYTVATATGLTRMVNNRHWLSDVMTGAAIGILSTELGYYLADLIFRDKGLHRSPAIDASFSKEDTPSFLGLYLGFNVPLSQYDLTPDITLKTSSGSTSGIEGAYFFNPYVGVGGRCTFSNVSVLLNETEAQDKTFRFGTFHVGGYFSYPLSRRVAIGSKLLAGYTHYSALQLTDVFVPAKGGFSYGTGLSGRFRAGTKLNFSLFADYNLLPPHGVASGEYMHTLTVGGMVSLAL